MKTIRFGNITIYITDTYADLGKKAAEVFATELKNNPGGNYGLATGSTPISMYQELIKKYEKGSLDFSGISTFNLDEYYPIKKDNPRSYDFFMKEQLINHININPANVHIPSGEVLDPREECLRYEELIKSSGGLNLQVLGIGVNGHIGFNEPNDFFAKETNYVPLTESTIAANARFFDNIEEVPKHAITMGIKTIMQAKKILLLANSAHKSEIVAKSLLGDITPKIPASILQLHPHVEVILDKEAAAVILKTLDK